jgi:hypothetical protein
MFKPVLCAVVGALAYSTAALAEPIRLVNDGRAAGAVIPGPAFVNESSGDVLTGNANFSNDTTNIRAHGALVSSIADLMHISGTGNASSALTTTVPSEGGTGFASFNVVFEIDRPYLFNFEGVFGSSGVSQYSGGYWEAFLIQSLVEFPAFSFGFAVDRIEPGATPVSAEGLLAPGTWTFASRAFAGNGGFSPESPSNAAFASNSSFTFTLGLSPVEPAPVPEPATFTLITTGLLGAAHTRRRRKNA